ncbi:MAG: hypothetical protein DRH89_07680 [Candidatus Cloacimonadota bacterium]|nr:MAG: hypothetical protein DRH89_07680 [Candidatus Cloacimonadota bacterium]
MIELGSITLFEVDDIAEEFGLDNAEINEIISSGMLMGITIGSKFLIREIDLQKWLNQCRSVSFGSFNPFELPFSEAKEKFEIKYLDLLLFRCKGDVSQAAKESHIQRENMYVKFKKYNIDPKKYRFSDGLDAILEDFSDIKK